MNGRWISTILMWFHFIYDYQEVSRLLDVESLSYSQSSNNRPNEQPAVYLHSPMWGIQSQFYLFPIKS